MTAIVWSALPKPLRAVTAGIAMLAALLGGIAYGPPALSRPSLQDVATALQQLQTQVGVLEDDVVPVGTIVVWWGQLADIPDGWALCNGANGTPDLREKFVMGASSAHPPGTQGGEAEHSHAPWTHRHQYGHFHGLSKIGVSSKSDHNHGLLRAPVLPGYWTNPSADLHAGHGHLSNNDGEHTHSVAGAFTDLEFPVLTSFSDVVAGSVANAPPFYRLAYIVKVAE